MCCARPSGCSHQAAERLWVVSGLSETGDLFAPGCSWTRALLRQSLDEQHSSRFGTRRQSSERRLWAWL